jgi:hypothetical protein
MASGAFANLLAAFRPDAKPPASADGTGSSAATAGGGAGSLSTADLENAETKLRGRLDSLLAGFQSALFGMMSEKGVDLTAGVTLEADGLGSLRVVGDHPHKGIIETTLAGHSELAELFRQIEANASVLAAVRGVRDGNPAGEAGKPLRVRVDGAGAVCLAAGG